MPQLFPLSSLNQYDSELKKHDYESVYHYIKGQTQSKIGGWSGNSTASGSIIDILYVMVRVGLVLTSLV